MRRLTVVMSCLVLLLFAAALPAFAGDADLLGSGATPPDTGVEAAQPVAVEVSAAPSQTVGEDVLATTGLDSGAALLVGLGLMAAGGAAVATSRSRARS